MKAPRKIAQLHKQQAELSEFDEKLRHYADQRISLNLDDGVKVNYGKFGDLLAEVKAITGELRRKIYENKRNLYQSGWAVIGRRYFIRKRLDGRN